MRRQQSERFSLILLDEAARVEIGDVEVWVDGDQDVCNIGLWLCVVCKGIERKELFRCFREASLGTYIDLVFFVSDAEIVQQTSFVEVHQRTCLNF